VTLREFGKKYIIYDKSGKVVIITREKRIAIAYARAKR
tara:strand:- start:1570 stop:1683 length:114 start_codon:yes stop_codon:yes gene_type:complete